MCDITPSTWIVSRYLDDGSREFFAGIEGEAICTSPIIFDAFWFDAEKDAEHAVSWLTLTQGMAGFTVSRTTEPEFSPDLKEILQ